MPSVSQAQHNLMEMAAHPKSRKKAKGKLPSVKVAQEFVEADKRKNSKKLVKRAAK
jgi:hypothetical protein